MQIALGLIAGVVVSELTGPSQLKDVNQQNLCVSLSTNENVKFCAATCDKILQLPGVTFWSRHKHTESSELKVQSEEPQGDTLLMEMETKKGF